MPSPLASRLVLPRTLRYSERVPIRSDVSAAYMQMQARRTPLVARGIMIYPTMDTSLQTFGERLRHARKHNPNRGMRTLQAVAGYIGVTHSTVSQWESNKTVPDFQNLVTVAEACQTSLDWLIRGGEMSSGIESRIRKVHPMLRAGLVERIHREIDETLEAEKRLPAEMLAETTVKDADKRLLGWSTRGKLPPARDS